jgi:hypothetical protein
MTNFKTFFKSKEDKFRLDIKQNLFYYHKGLVNSKIKQTETPKSFNISFINLSGPGYLSGEKHKANPLEVFKKVLEAVKNFIIKNKPLEITFSSAPHEMSRLKLYYFLANHIEKKIPEYKYLPIPNNIKDWVDQDYIDSFVEEGQMYVIVKKAII